MTGPGLTPSQTAGPFFAIGLPWPDGPYAVAPGTPGAVWLRGRVLDGAGDPVTDALVETWQADPDGRFDHPDDPRAAAGGYVPSAAEPSAPGFRRFARCPTDEAGRYAILTLRPGPVPGPDGSTQAPHLAMSVFARGLLDRVVTRVYFPDQPEANAADPILASVVDSAARATLVAAPAADGYTFDVHLQGPHETAFFDV